MGKWLAEFLAEHQESLPDKADTLTSLSGMSGPDLDNTAGNSVPLVDRVTEHEPIPPLQPGWLVVYKNRQGKLCGGPEDREHGTVSRCDWNAPGWSLWLTDGQQISLGSVTGVTKTNVNGDLLGAWQVREHGLDGHGRAKKGTSA